jgi:hypothetical protein
MPSVQARRKATQRRARSKQRKRIKVRNRLNKAIARARAQIAKRRKLIRQGSGDPGVKAVRYALRFAGKTESPPGSNDAPFLAAWRAKFPTLAWMKGQPWCGLFCIAAWELGAGKRLPDGTVYTPNIDGGGAYGTEVSASNARPGDMVVFHFGSGDAKHVGLARGPAKGGVIPTIEGNTAFDNSGSQSNGGAVAIRNRSLGLVLKVVRPN